MLMQHTNVGWAQNLWRISKYMRFAWGRKFYMISMHTRTKWTVAFYASMRNIVCIVVYVWYYTPSGSRTGIRVNAVLIDRIVIILSPSSSWPITIIIIDEKKASISSVETKWARKDMDYIYRYDIKSDESAVKSLSCFIFCVTCAMCSHLKPSIGLCPFVMLLYWLITLIIHQ